MLYLDAAIVATIRDEALRRNITAEQVVAERFPPTNLRRPRDYRTRRDRLHAAAL
jgi:hypothetical protein